MKKRYAGGVGAILLIGILIGQFFKLPGLGGSGANDESPTSTTEKEEPSDETAIRNASVSNDVSNTVSKTQPEEPIPFVTVAIEEDNYRLTTSDSPLEGNYLSLGELIDRVTKTTGTNEGIRLRVLFHRNAQEGALADLHKALASAGVKREEIQEISGYLN